MIDYPMQPQTVVVRTATQPPHFVLFDDRPNLLARVWRTIKGRKSYFNAEQVCPVNERNGDLTLRICAGPPPQVHGPASREHRLCEAKDGD